MNVRVFGIVPVLDAALRAVCDADTRHILAVSAIHRLARALPFEHLYLAGSLDAADLAESRTWPSARVELLRCAGATRADVVRSTLERLRPRARPDDWLLLHDLAFPCVSIVAVRRLMSEVGYDAVGGLLAVPMPDTLKRADAGSASHVPRVLRTEDRRELWQAQMPQAFRFAVLERALRVAVGSDFDELEAIEMLVQRGEVNAPRLVAGSVLNVRVSDDASAALALAVLRAQGEGSAQTGAG
jgi:2-C-methyl-D-erythritol 4-phosphate cytidylyltransferase